MVLHTISDKMFRSVFIIFRELLNIHKAYVKNRWIIKYIEICA